MFQVMLMTSSVWDLPALPQDMYHFSVRNCDHRLIAKLLLPNTQKKKKILLLH